ncbi:MAG: hypothetical protein ABUT20_49565 [Bacteroidota bacterium]
MTAKLPKKRRPSILSRHPYKRRDESEMAKIVSEIDSGMIAKRAACVKYGLNRNTLALFIRQYSVRNLDSGISNQIFSSMTPSQKTSVLEKKIKELTKALELAKLKNESLETLIKVSEEELQIKIRKKRGTIQSKE